MSPPAGAPSSVRIRRSIRPSPDAGPTAGVSGAARSSHVWHGRRAERRRGDGRRSPGVSAPLAKDGGGYRSVCPSAVRSDEAVGDLPAWVARCDQTPPRAPAAIPPRVRSPMPRDAHAMARRTPGPGNSSCARRTSGTHRTYLSLWHARSGPAPSASGW
jgi:hypothetical protein